MKGDRRKRGGRSSGRDFRPRCRRRINGTRKPWMYCRLTCAARRSVQLGVDCTILVVRVTRLRTHGRRA